MLISKSIASGRTDIGKLRATNEDQFLVADLSKWMTVHSSTLPIADETDFYSGLKAQLLLVADGISGEAGGEIASQIGVGTVAKYVLNTKPWIFSLEHDREDDQEEELLAAMLQCEEAIGSEVRAHPELEGMGTTLTMAFIVWPRMYVVHVGDSRCYLSRAGELSQLTHDQTAAQALVDQGTITPQQANKSPLSHVLLSSVGRGLSSFRPEVYKVQLEPGDRVLLCSDGVTSQLDDETIAALLASADSAAEACDSLVDAANEAGGPDNITTVVSICQPPIERKG